MNLKRTQHPESNPALDTDVKPELKVSVAKKTHIEDISSKRRVDAEYSSRCREQKFQIKQIWIDEVQGKMAASDEKTAERCSPELLGDCKPKASWKISNGIINETKRQTEAESPECTPEGVAR